jgi:hypothetical protein
MATPYGIREKMSSPFIGKFARDFMCRFAVVALCFAAVLPLRADPAPSLDQLTVIDQGSELTLVWHFYYKLLPQKFTLPEYETQVDLGDAATLRQNLSRIARNAFAITIDGKLAPPADLSQINLAADGGCYATLFYSGRKNARLELRETLLPLYPPS